MCGLPSQGKLAEHHRGGSVREGLHGLLHGERLRRTCSSAKRAIRAPRRSIKGGTIARRHVRTLP